VFCSCFYHHYVYYVNYRGADDYGAFYHHYFHHRRVYDVYGSRDL
jgi:hypothetical protein